MSLAEFKKAPGHLLRRAQQAATAMFVEEMADVELTSVQFLTLIAIMDKAEVDATRLSELVAVDRATIGGVIERLIRKGLIVRHASSADKRIKILVALPAAHDLVHACKAKVDAVQQRILTPLSPAERKVFLSLLGRVAREDVDPPYAY